MQAARILPWLIAVLAAAYSLFAADWVSGMAAMAELPILAGVQAIIFADAGDSASSENIAAVINILILDLIGKIIRRYAGSTRAHLVPVSSPEKDTFDAAKQRAGLSLARMVAPAALRSGPGLTANAAGGDIRIAIGPAAALRLAFVERAGESVDEPGRFVSRAFNSDIAAAECGDQRG